MSTPLLDLLTQSRELGFLGPGPVEDHLHHATAFVAACTTAPARALDLGAGGGLPGLVIAALAWPDTTWCFLDSSAKRTAFLTEAVDALDLGQRVSVVTARAEEVGRDQNQRATYDLVVSRSFGGPAVTAECAAPLLRPDGFLVVSEPPSSDTGQRWPDDGVAKFGLGPAEPVVITDGPNPVHLVRMKQQRIVDDRYPRRVGIPAKRPLF